MFRYFVIIVVFIVMLGMGGLLYFMFGPWAVIGLTEDQMKAMNEAASRLVEKKDISMATEDKQQEVYNLWETEVKDRISKVKLEPRQMETVMSEFDKTYELIGEKNTFMKAADNSRENTAKALKSADETKKQLEEKKKQRDELVAEYAKKWGLTMMRPAAAGNFEVKFTD